MPIWTANSTGTYADVQCGKQHVRNTIANLIALTFGEPERMLIRTLRADQPDCGEVLRALNKLNDRCEGAHWVLGVDGSLLLLPLDNQASGK